MMMMMLIKRSEYDDDGDADQKVQYDDDVVN